MRRDKSRVYAYIRSLSLNLVDDILQVLADSETVEYSIDVSKEESRMANLLTHGWAIYKSFEKVEKIYEHYLIDVLGQHINKTDQYHRFILDIFGKETKEELNPEFIYYLDRMRMVRNTFLRRHLSDLESLDFSVPDTYEYLNSQFIEDCNTLSSFIINKMKWLD